VSTINLSYRDKVRAHVKLLGIFVAAGTLIKIFFAFVEYSYFSHPLEHIQFSDIPALFEHLSGYMKLASHARSLMIFKFIMYLGIIINLYFILKLKSLAIYLHFIMQLSLFVIPVLMIGFQNHSGLSLLAFGKFGLMYFVFQSLTFIGGLLFFYLFGRVLVHLHRFRN
jgi:hypothetical protein